MENEREIYLERVDIGTKVIAYFNIDGSTKDLDITCHVDPETIQKLNYGAKKTIFIKTQVKDIGWHYDNYMIVPKGLLPELKGIEQKFLENIKLN